LMVGIVIDDAVVVLENIFRFVEEKGLPPFQAAVEGTREIGMAVTATTLSLLAVFLPVGFMAGIVGRFMSSFGFTASFAIAVSLLVSFTLTPMLAARMIKRKQHAAKENPHKSESGEKRDYSLSNSKRSTARRSQRSRVSIGPSTARTQRCSNGRWAIVGRLSDCR